MKGNRYKVNIRNMKNLRKSVNNIGAMLVIFLFIVVGATLTLNLILNKTIVNKSFSKIEDEEVNATTHRAEKIFKSQIDQLEAQTKDYALWDDVYNKVQEKNIDKQWFRENFTEFLPKNFDMDLVIVVNRNTKVIAGNESDYIIMFDRKISQTLIKDKYDENTVVSGFKKYNGGLYIISVCPIFQSNNKGICQGAVVLGKKISPKYIQKINDEFGGNIFITYDDKVIAGSEINKKISKNIIDINENRDKPLYRIDSDNIIGSLPIRDISENGAGYIKVLESRNAFILTKDIMSRNTFSAFLICTIIIIILGHWCRKTIVKSINGLQKQMKRMEDENSLSNIEIDEKLPDEIIGLSESFNNLIDKIKEHKKENQELKIFANTDYLTSTYNHKYYFESMDSKISEGYKEITILFCDIDKFKLANDSYGHDAGDFILKESAAIIKDEVKDAGGMVFRYGGEEFVVMLCDYNCEQAFLRAEKIRKRILESEALQKYADYFPISLSIGIASYPKHSLDAAGLINKADSAMYFSKQNGRNQCNIYNENMDVFLKDSEKDINKDLLTDSVLALAEAVDAKDKYTGKHSKMVAKYSIMLGEEIGLSELEKRKLRMGALLHDCGKIGIPDSIINKPGKLTDSEYQTIRNHTLLGYNIIKHITDDEEIIDCIRSHHESWNGSGYPDGISKDSINLFARIVCIADAYHAMTSDRAYRKALTPQQALCELINKKGIQFDSELVDCFVRAIRRDMNYSITSDSVIDEGNLIGLWNA